MPAPTLRGVSEPDLQEGNTIRRTHFLTIAVMVPGLLAAMVPGLLAASGVDAHAAPLGAPSADITGPVWVTLAYIGVYYAFITHGLGVKVRLKREYAERGEKFDRYFDQDREMLASDRIQLNMLEHMPVFLVLLWLHAFIVSSGEATILGGIYTGTRALYPFLLGGRLGRNIPARLLFVTFTGYIILVVFAVRIATHL